MKKIILLFMFLSFLVGCSLSNTPTSKVEDLLTKYQKVDIEVSDNITDTINRENLTEKQKERYKKLIEKQYFNLSYEIKDEVTDGDEANVVVEIVVLDYKKAINETNDYYKDRNDYTVEEYNNTKLDNLEKVKDKVTYTIEIPLRKDKNDNWHITSLNNETIKKILGMY